MPFALWNAFTALRVSLPNTPSTAPVKLLTSRCCSALTASPRLPYLSSPGYGCAGVCVGAGVAGARLAVGAGV